MAKEYYYLVNDVAMGPYSAEEMLGFELPDDTPVTDNINGERWRTAGDYDFRNETEHRRAPNTIRLEGAVYQFYFKKNGKGYGPRSAQDMHKLNLPPDTPVTEVSLDGFWATAADFDFIALSQDEQLVNEVRRRASDKTALTGLIWLIVGGVVTYVSYKSSYGGTYVIATGAIVWGFIQLVKGLTGNGDIPKDAFSYEERKSATGAESAFNIPPEKLNELYAELELTPNASNGEVRSAYRRMAKRFHPDRYSAASDEERRNATARFRNINEAYELIKQLRNIK